MSSLIEGDCIQELKKLSDNSIDACITDPPYELGFMGKKWDNTGIAYQASLWQEVLRVLKPGGHLLSFGGSRTYHRMACAIEDAGFEIRDQIMWVYGCLSEDTEILTINGWERYHKAIDKYPVLCYNIDNNSFEFNKPKRRFVYENEHTAYNIKSDKTDQIVSRNHRVLVERGGRKVFAYAETLERQEDIPFLESLSDLPETIYDTHKGTSIKKQDLLKKVCKQGNKGEEQREKTNNVNLPYLQKEVLSKWSKQATPKNILLKAVCWECKGLVKAIFSKWQGQKKTWNRFKWREKSCLEGLSNILQETRKLLTDKICQMSERIFRYGSERWLCYGTSLNNGSISQSVLTENRGSAPHKPQPTRQQDRKPNVISHQQSPQITRSTITPIEYHGKVWCVEVETGAFVARRNGKIFITGNSGFPKSHNIGKAVDKLQGNEREKIGRYEEKGDRSTASVMNNKQSGFGSGDVTKGNSDWEGWGTALKPAHEPIVLARKPLSEKTVAKNVLKWGVGGIDIDGCRVEHNEDISTNGDNHKLDTRKQGWGFKSVARDNSGRFPANLIHDGSQQVMDLFPETKPSKAGIRRNRSGIFKGQGAKVSSYGYGDVEGGFNDSGSAARFFYCAKASKKERNMGCEGLEDRKMEVDGDGRNQAGFNSADRKPMLPRKNHHPTVKPITLMKYLVKLISREGQTVLDPFLGSGTTGIACKELKREFIGIEKEKEYIEIAKRRIGASC